MGANRKEAQSETRKFKREFSDKHPHMYIDDISDSVVEEYLNRDYVCDESMEKKMDLFSDYCLANQLCDVQE